MTTTTAPRSQLRGVCENDTKDRDATGLSAYADPVDLTPKQADFADHALRILAREGMAAVTFRSVAAESGRSLGAVQKAFATKDDLVGAMFSHLRSGASPAPTEPPGSPDVVTWLTNLFVQIQPLDDRVRNLTLQGAAFAERAAYDTDIAQAIAASDAELRGLIEQLVGLGISRHEVDPSTDATAAAWAFLALAQGAATQSLYDPQPADVVRTFAETAIRSLLPVPTRDTSAQESPINAVPCEMPGEMSDAP